MHSSSEIALEPVARDAPEVQGLYDYLTLAVGLYRAAGHREVPAYNDNPKADLWLERDL